MGKRPGRNAMIGTKSEDAFVGAQAGRMRCPVRSFLIVFTACLTYVNVVSSFHFRSCWRNMQSGTQRVDVQQTRQHVYRARAEQKPRRHSLGRSGAQELLETSRQRGRVERLCSDVDRVPLASLVPGQQLRGRIISIVDHGLFVDVGTKRDGLVHIKDVSETLFTTDLQSKFTPGQDVKVWVKFVSTAEKKLGLQMYPPSTAGAAVADNLRKLSIQQLQVGQEVRGKVVRATDFGVYVDIGACEVTPFLHRRKIKSNNRQRKYTAAQLVPLGSEITGYVHQIDASRGRVGLTTYPPEEWEGNLRSLIPDLYEGMVEDNEELGGDRRAANLRAVERTMALGFGDQDGEDQEEGEDEEGEVLSAAEVRRLTTLRPGGPARVLIDDFDEVNQGTVSGGAKDNAVAEERTATPKTAGEDQVSTDELFDLLSDRRPHLTFSALKKWHYVTVLMRDGALTSAVLEGLFRRAGAVRGRLEKEQFPLFLDLFVAELGLQEDDGSYVDDANDGEDNGYAAGTSSITAATSAERSGGSKQPAQQQQQRRVGRSVYLDLGESPLDLQDISLPSPPTRQTIPSEGSGSATGKGNFNGAHRSTEPPAPTPALRRGTDSGLVRRDKGDNQVATALFHSVATKGATHVDFATCLRTLGALRTLVAQDAANAVRLRQAFDACTQGSGVKGTVDVSGFRDFVQGPVAQLLAQAVVNPKSGDDEKSDRTPNREGTARNNPAVDAAEVRREDEGADEDEDAQVTLEAYQSLAKGKGHVSLKDLLNWDFVYTLLAENVLTEEQLGEMVQHRAGGNRKGVTYDGFDRLVDDLVLLYRNSELDHNEEAEEQVNAEVEVELEQSSDGGEVEDEVVDEAEAVEVDTVAEFERLSAGQGYLNIQDLQGWELLRPALEQAGFVEQDWQRVLAAAGVQDVRRISQEEFEVVFDEVLSRIGYCEEAELGDKRDGDE